MRLLLAQLSPQPGDIPANVARVRQAMVEHPDVELAIFPELFLSGYELTRARDLSIAADDRPLQELRYEAARHRTALIVGLIERTEDGALANAAACIDADGSLTGIYRKTHLFGGAERRTFVAGEELLLVQLRGRLVAPLICFDVEFPEPARLLAGAGAELLVTVAANMDPYGADHELATRARALDNRRPHAYVNQVGRQRNLSFVGGSSAIDADARVLAAGGRDEELIEVEMPLGVWAVPDEIDYVRHARGDLPVRVPATTTAERGG